MITVHINVASQLHVLFQRIARASLQVIPRAHKGPSAEIQMHVHVAGPFGVELHIVQLHVALSQCNRTLNRASPVLARAHKNQIVLGFQ